MKVKFWGTRGGLPGSFTAKMHRQKIVDAIRASQGHSLKTPQAVQEFVDEQLAFAVSRTYGTNTPCVEVESVTEDAFVLLDAGSGLRDFAVNLVSIRPGPKEFHLLLSHLHWDHIQGFPFFGPAYQSSNKVVIHTFHQEAEQAFRTLMSQPFFPVQWDDLEGQISFEVHTPGETYKLLDYEIKSLEQLHDNKSYAYRLEKEGVSIVYSTDSEHTEDYKQEGYPFVPFLKEADMVIFDTMATYKEKAMRGWGHSSNKIAVNLCNRARVKNLVLFHHDRENSDETLDHLWSDTLVVKKGLDAKFPEKINIAYDGLELDV